MKRLFLLCAIFCLVPFALADKYIAKGDDTAIISNFCLYDATDGVNKITNITSEDAGLKITLTSSDHATLQVYDVPGEIEPITTFGTWLAPTALNVRFEADPTTGCYEFQFLADSFENGVTANLAIEDTSTPTFMDRDIDIQIWASSFFDLIDGTTTLLSSRDVGLLLGPVAITTVTTQTELILPSGASNADAYDNAYATFQGDAEECHRQIIDYTVVPPTIFLRAVCPFTLTATTDTVRIHAGASGDALAVADSVVNSNASAIAALNDIAAIDVWEVDATSAQTQGTFGQLHGDPIASTETLFKAVVTDAAGANVAADIAANQADLDRVMGTFLNCEVNTLNFAGSSTTLACILTDLDSSPVTQASDDLEGLQILVTSGADIREARFINNTVWDGANSELQLTISRALPATQADAVTVIIR